MPTYTREADELPWEVRQSVAQTLRYYPKENGQNTIVTSATYTINQPDGTEVSSGSITPTAIPPTGTQESSSLGVPIPAIATLGERYQARITFTVTATSSVIFDVKTFDVVLFPFGNQTTSYDDLVELHADMPGVLDRIGQRLGSTAGSAAQLAGASTCAYHARLMRCEHLWAAAHAFLSIAHGPDDGDDASSKLYRHFRDAAQTAWQQVGPLAYDGSEDLIEDTTIQPGERVIHQRRVQA